MRRMLWRTQFRRWLAPWSSLFWFRQQRAISLYRSLCASEAPAPDKGGPLRLTRAQQEAAVSNEQATMVVASAGSGKTAVVAARVVYLVRSKLAKPEDILLLAFNRAAAQAMRARCAALLGSEVQATTFHALGRSILSSASPRTLVVSRLATDEQHLDVLISSSVAELYKDREFATAMSRFIRLSRRPSRGGGQSQTLGEYERDLDRGELRTLTGELVKSRGELDIANYLYVSGIRFAYEKPFDHVVSGAPKDYRPDFYLPATGVFIEFFGIDRAGNTAPEIDRKKYLEEMEWKRAVHAKFGTGLIQLYQYQRNNGTLISELDRALQGHGVRGEALEQTTVLRLVDAPDAAGGFTSLVKAFLIHFKSTDLSFTELSRRAARFGGLEAERARAFATVFQGIFDRYQQELAAEGAIDFSDMITEAAAAVRRGAFSPRWRHIIVDEFQDISVGRYRLLDQLLRGPMNPRLFAVGDDWQSINRFAGSELTIMTEADRYFRSPTVLFLRDTFRFGQDLADVSGEFVMRNPGQLRKRVQGIKNAAKPALSLWWTNWEDSKALLKLVERLAKRSVPSGTSLLVLARYNKPLPRNWVQRELTKQWNGGSVRFSTVHAAKGLEADYVILLGVRGEMPRAENGYLSIPSAQSDDPLLELVMPEPESFEFAEERRLFYVALTRAKRHVALLCNPTFPSAFAAELAANSKVAARGQPYIDIPCPKCRPARRRGALRWQNGAYRQCDHAKCGFVIRRCACGAGYMVPGEREAGLRCTDALCEVGQTH